MNSEKDQVQQQDRVQQLLERLGKAYLERQQYGEAFEKYAQLLDMMPENRIYLLNTAIASIGMGRASDSALQLYEKAVAKNQQSNALKVGLATLFMQNNVTTAFALQICEATVRMKPQPPGSHKIRLFLKGHYEETGDTAKLSRIEHEVVFSTSNAETIRSYLEGLWWEGKFAEASAAIKSAPSMNGADLDLSRELMLTDAYQHYFEQKKVSDPLLLKQYRETIDKMDFKASLIDFRNFLLLQHVLPKQASEEAPTKKEIDEYEFILGDVSLDEVLHAYGKETPAKSKPKKQGDFDFERDVLQQVENSFDGEPAESAFSYEYRSILFLQPFTKTGRSIPSKLTNLFGLQLSKKKNTIVRQFGNGFLCLGKDAVTHVETLINLLRHLDEYNAAIAEGERIFVNAAFSIVEAKASELNASLYGQELMSAAHLLRFADKTDKEKPNPGGIVLIRGSEQDLARLKAKNITLLFKGKFRLLPGLEAEYAEIIWRNPLSMLEKGQTYRINRFELKKCLVKHSSYATYIAQDRQLDRPVMVKIMLPEHAVAILQNSSKRDELFEKLRAIGRINNPSIANLYDMGEHNNMIYFVREHIEGKPLNEHPFEGDQRESEILSVLQTLLRALIGAQRQGIAHLNLKAGNIWMSEAQQIKITDFYFAGFSEDFARAKVLYPAQWRNIAPEVLAGENGDFRSDIYSLGILAYELITGQHPYKTTSSIHSPKDIRKVKILPLENHDTAHNPAWDPFVMKAIQTDPAARFQTLAEMELELRKIQMQLMQQTLNATSA